MRSFNQNAFGQTIRVKFHEEISAATGFSMTLEPKQGTALLVTPTLGTVEVTEGAEKILASQYVEYVLKEGQLSGFLGLWKVRATATISATEEKAGRTESFWVVQ